MADDLKLKLVLSASDGISNVVKSAVNSSTKDFEALSKKLDKTSEHFTKFGQKATVIGAGLTTISGLGVKMAADFQSGMTNTSTLIDTNTESLDDMGKQVLSIAKRTPVAINDLTTALYNIRSAGMEASDQFKILEKSAQLGIAGLGSTDEAVDLVTSSINAWQLSGAKAEKTYDLIFRTVKTGKTTISGIAQGFGAVAGTVAAAGIELDDYLASVAALTTTGQPAAQAHTQIKAAISGMTRESKESKQVLTHLGAKNFKDLIQKSGGMVGAFKRIADTVKGNDAMILKLFGSTEAYNAVVGLCTKQNKAYVDTLKGMRDGSNAVDEAFIKQSKTLNNVMQTVKNASQKIGIDFGNSLVPMITVTANALVKFTDTLDRIPQGLKSAIAIGTLGTGLMITGLGTTSLLIGASIKSYREMLTMYREIGIASALSGIKTKNIEIDVKKGLDAIYNSFKNMPLAWNSFKIGAENGSKAVVNFIKSAPANAFNGIKSSLNAIKMGFINFIPNCKNAILAMRTFNITCALNPIGLVVGAVIAGGFLIYKYWKPISAFFRGTFIGIKEGLKPLQPMFNRVGQAIKPLGDWIKRVFTPINTNGDRALAWGKAFGNFIADCIKGAVRLYEAFKKVVTLGGRIKIGGQPVIAEEKTDGSHFNGLSRVPFDNYKANLHKDEAVLTAKEATQWRNLKGGNNGAVTLNYAPVINMSSTVSASTKSEFMEELRKHKTEIYAMLKDLVRREDRRAYV